VARAAAAVARATHEYRAARYMLSDAMAELEDLLESRHPTLKSVFLAAAAVHSVAGELSGNVAALADLRGWLESAKAGKRRTYTRRAWPTMAEAINGRTPRLRKLAEECIRDEDKAHAEHLAWLATRRAERRAKAGKARK
jgi:hypothetical protein